MIQWVVFALALAFFPLELSALLPGFVDLGAKNLKVKLESPVYRDGVMSTDQGGIIEGKDLYIQAKKIQYIRREEQGEMVRRIEAEGDLFFRFKNRVYLGSRLEYNLNNETAIIYDVLTNTGPWFIGGSKLFLKPDGSGLIEDGYFTSDEGEQNDWTVQAKDVFLSKNNTIKAQNVRFTLFKKPIFWLPSLSKDLNRESASPLRYRFRYNGSKDLRVGISYTFDVGENISNRLLLDVSTRRGLGGGFETEYKNPNKKERFNAFNYYAHDLSSNDSDKKSRYRFQGKYTNVFFDDKLDLRARYDKLSDDSFPSDFTSRGLDSGRAGPTEALLSRKEPNWISTLNTKVRLNQFQSVKQQLPLFQFNMRPMQLGSSRIVLDNRLSAGYLSFLYAHQTPDMKNFWSSRFALTQSLYRSFSLSHLSVTPRVGYRAIGYGNSPEHDSKLLAQGIVGLDCHTRFQRTNSFGRHIVQPYASYDYYSRPTVNPHRHYLFDFQDGIYRQDSLRFGVKNFITYKRHKDFSPELTFDLYARAFFNSPNIGKKIPKVYLEGTLKPTAYMLYSLDSAWDTQRNNLDHINARADVTVNEDIAFGLEYRHRNSWSWRKLDHDNFMLDTFHSQHVLRHSEVSDRRNTFLTRLYLRLMPSLALECSTRHGWRRRHAKPYTEYEVNVIHMFRGLIKFTLTFRHRETGNDFLFDFALGGPSHDADTSFKRIGQGNYDLP